MNELLYPILAEHWPDIEKTIEELQKKIYPEPAKYERTDYEQFMHDEVWGG